MNRVKRLKRMDKFIRENINDEELIIGIWLYNGVPDGCDDSTLEFIAEDKITYQNCCEAFIDCCLKGLG